MGKNNQQKSIKDILEKEDNNDYSGFITNPSQGQDDRSFLKRLISSIKPTISFSFKKIPDSVDDVKRGIGFKISGGTDF